ncbi:MAG: alpha-galactosidase [Lachnospiraceae bacterium]|nr:alpha-galactosidase [Lachnospiraceae bacterium]
MGIRYLENEKLFKLDTPHSSYVCGIFDKEKFLLHLYYGARISDDDIRYISRTLSYPFSPERNNRDRGMFLDGALFEYPTEGLGDYRQGCLDMETEGGHSGCSLSYVNHKIYRGKPALDGLPSTFASITQSGEESDCETLEITLKDELTGLITTLFYSVFDGLDAIVRSVRFENTGSSPLYLNKVLSACLELEPGKRDVITLHGSWARERNIERTRVTKGVFSIGSFKGESSHQINPFMAVSDRNTTQTQGQVYGFSFVYSGNFTASVECSQFDSLRCLMGINPKGFRWKLDKGAVFNAPEVIMVYSGQGLEHMSHTFHDVFREHLISGANLNNKYRNAPRPVLINNWEATYFDFDNDKLVAIAKEAAENGIEMLVMDDGWFGNRSSDNMALGDWYVNEDKIKGGLHKLVEDVKDAGLKFGIWIEPEMVSPDSDLYREHPDFAIAIPGRTGTLMRNQYVLDFSRREVVDEIYSRIHAVLSSADISYVKWDMNRPLSDIGSYALENDRQGELFHRYVLGVYEMMGRLLKDFPDLLLANCSGGGGRFDAGMLYFSPQIWCSDDTDAIERLAIQEGTAMVYPLSTMGAHISDCPNHVTGRVVPFETRGYVALAGTFGYELDITRISQEDRDMIPGQVEMYHKYNKLIRTGDYYRLSSYRDNGTDDSWMVVSKDRSYALVTYIKVMARPNRRSGIIRLRGLDPERKYSVSSDKRVLGLDYPLPGAAGYADADERSMMKEGLVLHGDTLMNAGIIINENVPDMAGDFRGVLIDVVAIS